MAARHAANRLSGDVSNRPAVIMRGSNYTFFVNGHNIGSYHDNQLAENQVGLYSDSLSRVSAFSDFAIYPFPPTSIPWL